MLSAPSEGQSLAGGHSRPKWEHPQIADFVGDGLFKHSRVGVFAVF
jgi:hypothetical protein